MKKKIFIICLLFCCQNLLFEYQTDIKEILFIQKATKFLESKNINNKETILAYIYQASKKYNLHPELVLSIAFIESRLNPFAINKNKDGSIDIGVMQINNKHHKEILNTKDNIFYGTEYLYKCIKRYGIKGIYKYNGNKKYIKRVFSIYRELKVFEKSSKIQGRNVWRSLYLF